MPDMQESVGWVAFIDVFGFKNELKLSPSGELFDRLKEASAKLTQIVNYTHLNKFKRYTRHYVFSDSIFLLYQISPKKYSAKENILRQLVDDCRRIMTSYVALDLPLRGGISFGKTFSNDHIMIGQPIVKAVQYESEIEAPFIFIPYCELCNTNFAKDKYDTSDLINTRDGISAGHAIYPEHREKYIEYVQNKLHKYLTLNDQIVSAKWNKALTQLKKYSNFPLED